MTNRCRDMGKGKKDKELENSVQTWGRWELGGEEEAGYEEEESQEVHLPVLYVSEVVNVVSGSGKLISALCWAAQIWPFVQDDPG